MSGAAGTWESMVPKERTFVTLPELLELPELQEQPGHEWQ